MKHKISCDNPFGFSSAGLTWELVKDNSPNNYLDYGANEGKLLLSLAKNKLIGKGVGVDLNVEAVLSGTQKLNGITNVEMKAIEKGKPLAFSNDSFDCISIVGVLEHIADQRAILRELNRVLKPGGLFVICVPGKHLFSFLDMGNFKFIFPRMHKIIFSLMRGKEEYKRRYVECSNGMFGDIEVEQMWHQHYAKNELSDLLVECGFNNIKFDGHGFFMRVLLLPMPFMPGFIKNALRKLISIDSKLFSSWEIACFCNK